MRQVKYITSEVDAANGLGLCVTFDDGEEVGFAVTCEQDDPPGDYMEALSEHLERSTDEERAG